MVLIISHNSPECTRLGLNSSENGFPQIDFPPGGQTTLENSEKSQ